MIEKNAPIGIFDSGVGGLTVLKAFLQLYPFQSYGQSYVYIGDTARLPYGTKSPETIIRYSETITNALIGFKPKAIMVACNTASTYALPAVEAMAPDISCIGMIKPAVEAAIRATRNKHIAVIGTVGTITSNVYAREIYALDPTMFVSSVPCQLLVALAEENWVDTDIARATIQKYLDPLFKCDTPPDCLILGCTHFPLFEQSIRALYGDDIYLINTGLEAARLFKNLIIGKSDTAPRIDCYVTDNQDRFSKNMERFLGDNNKYITNIQLLDL